MASVSHRRVAVSPFDLTSSTGVCEGVPNGNSTQKSQLPLSRLGVNKVGLEGNFFGSYPVQYVVVLLATRVLCDVVASDGGCLQRE